MRQDFLEWYLRIAKVPTKVLQNIHHTLIVDCSSAEYSSAAKVDECVAQALLDINNADIVLDFCRSNGKPDSTIFDEFWRKLQTFLDKINPAVDERKHGEMLHMPFAISFRLLQEIIAERLQQKFPVATTAITSLEWIRLQFWPATSMQIVLSDTPEGSM